MKKCPYCHADIEDNARFCVFCMSSLQEKQKIENEITSNKRWPYVLAAFLLLVLIFGIIVFALSTNDANNSSSETSIPSKIISTDNSSDTSTVLSNNNTSENTTTDNYNSSQDKTEDNNSKNTVTKPNGNDNKTPSASSSQGSDTSVSSISTPTTTPSQSKPQQNDDSNAQGSEEQDSKQETVTKTEASYIYRNAVATDCYTEGNIPAQPITDVIVITGVTTAASDGIYNIPEEIDGKRVGAIMPNAFCDAAISSTVKKVVVPTSVKTIWQNAFSNCYNLTDIYLRGTTINIFETAFADVSNRTGTLTIHCARDCKTFGFYYYRNIADNYDALYQEWNGGEIK